MRLVFALLGLIVCVGPTKASDSRFEGWSVTCANAKGGANCTISTGAATLPDDAKATLSILRDAAKDTPPRLILTLFGKTPSPRPRLALVVDGGPPLRFATGADLSSGPGTVPSSTEIRLSDSAARRLLPFLRRGKSLKAKVSGEDGDDFEIEVALPGFAEAAAEADAQQKRTDRQDALTAMIGGATAAARSGKVRDVARDAVPVTLKSVMTGRDCPVWDATEDDPSFLADESFAADLGSGRTLWAIVCTSGAYNVEYALFVEDPSKAADRFEPLLFAAFVESIGWTGVDTLSNVAYDPDKKELTAFDKGRAAGDCGTVGSWEWVGAAFRMTEYRAKEECDGVGQPAKFPIVFRGER